MKFSTSAPLSVISLLGAIANAAPVPEPPTKNEVKAPGPTSTKEPNGMAFNEFNNESTLTNKPGEKKHATPDSLSSNPKSETILVCHKMAKQKPNAEKKMDVEPEDKEGKKLQDKSQEHKRGEPQSPKPKSPKHDTEEEEEMVLVCHENKKLGMGHETEQNKPAHDMKHMEGSSQGLDKTEVDKKPAGAKPLDKVPTKTTQ